MSKEKNAPTVNEGIQGNVNAEVLAVGRGARSKKIVNSERCDTTERAIEQLRDAIAKLQVKPDAAKDVEKSLVAITAEFKQGQPDSAKVKSHIANVLDKLKSAGIAVAEIAAIVEPISKIAAVFGVSLALF